MILASTLNCLSALRHDSSATQRINPTERAHELGGLSRIDYTDAFRAQTPHQRSPQGWARAVFEGPSWPLPSLLHFLWSKIVRLDLTPRTDRSRVLGWKITSRTADSLVLGSEAPGIQVRLVALIEPSAVSWTTTIRYKSWCGRAAFALLGPVHRALAKYLLARAAR